MYTYNKFGLRSSSSSSSLSSIAKSVSLVTKPPTSRATSSSSLRLKIAQDKAQREEDTFVSSDSSTVAATTPALIDYTNHYIHTGEHSTKFIRNVENPFDGYPKLEKLHQLKRQQIQKHATKAYGVRCSTDKIVPTLNKWIDKHELKFNVIMIGALVENQFILPLLNKLPIHKLCSKPGFLFIWSTAQKIQELTTLLNNDNFNRKFRRSEELIFLPIDEDSPYYPKQTDSMYEKSVLEKQQWHCWMCITGTVRRSTDNDLIHCNVDTDLQIESPSLITSPSSPKPQGKNACPEQIYKVAENFSNSNRRLHIIPSRLGYDTHIKLRPGWIIMGPDVLVNNFKPEEYKEELVKKSIVKYKQFGSGSSSSGGSNGFSSIGDGNGRGINEINGAKFKSVCPPPTAQYLVPQTNEIEDLRPKSPGVMVKSS